jgi:hypothetical protein
MKQLLLIATALTLALTGCAPMTGPLYRFGRGCSSVEMRSGGMNVLSIGTEQPEPYAIRECVEDYLSEVRK